MGGPGGAGPKADGGAAPGPGHWEVWPVLPDREGVAGAFAGVSGGALLVAGGANFPERKPWEGGTKVWHDTVYVLESPTGPWRTAGRLPRPLGYGVSVSVGVAGEEAMWCFGGSDAAGHRAEGFQLRWRGGQLETSPLPSLPRPCANMAWALAGRTLYVAGGTERADSVEALRTFWALSLDRVAAGWRELEPCPGAGRMLAVGAGLAEGEEFLLFSGASLHPGVAAAAPSAGPQRVYLREAWRYRPGRGWRRLADLPRATVAAAGPAPSVAGGFLVISGDDGSRVGFRPPERHPGFPRGVLRYDVGADRWREWGAAPFSRATVTVVSWAGRWVVASGETRPGVRTPEVWGWRGE